MSDAATDLPSPEGLTLRNPLVFHRGASVFARAPFPAAARPTPASGGRAQGADRFAIALQTWEPCPRPAGVRARGSGEGGSCKHRRSSMKNEGMPQGLMINQARILESDYSLRQRLPGPSVGSHKVLAELRRKGPCVDLPSEALIRDVLATHDLPRRLSDTAPPSARSPPHTRAAPPRAASGALPRARRGLATNGDGPGISSVACAVNPGSIGSRRVPLVRQCALGRGG